MNRGFNNNEDMMSYNTFVTDRRGFVVRGALYEGWGVYDGSIFLPREMKVFYRDDGERVVGVKLYYSVLNDGGKEVVIDQRELLWEIVSGNLEEI